VAFAVMWHEGQHRCELSQFDGRRELRVYVSDVLADDRSDSGIAADW
jgi:hypothetical protein